MSKRYGVIFFLIGFLIFSFAGPICIISKLKSQQVAELLGNMAEEEDEAEKEDGSNAEALIAIFDQITINYIQIENNYFSQTMDPLPLFNTNTLIQPPEA